MDIDTLKLLHLVARSGSFAAAARVLEIDPSVVSRSVAGAEAELGLRVFQRSTRRLNLTEDGRILVTRTEAVVEEYERAVEAARSAVSRPSGKLKMTASVAFGEVCIVPRLAQFRDAHPDIDLELVLTDSNLDLFAEEVDLAVRLAPVPSGDVIVTRLMPTRYRVCASPEYVAADGAPAVPSELGKHDVLCLTLPDFASPWQFRDLEGQVEAVAVRGSLRISNALALRGAARHGLGPALLADWLVSKDLEDGSLVDLFPDHDVTATTFDTSAWLLYPSRAYLPAKTRAMIDFLKAQF